MFKTSLALLIIGGLNWLLVGLFDYNLVNAIFGSVSVIERIIYVLVGLAAIYVAAMYNWGRPSERD